MNGSMIVDRAALLDALSLAAMAIKGRTPRPQLQCVLMEAKKGTLTISACDGEAYVRQEIGEVDVTSPGSALVPAGILRSVLASLADATVTIELSADHALVRSEDGSARLMGFDPKDFPPFPTIDKPTIRFEMPCADLAKHFARTSHAMNVDGARYGAYPGICVRIGGKSLVAVASDGNTMAVSTSKVESADKYEAIVPSKAIKIVQGILTGDGSLVLTGDGSLFSVEANGVTVTTSLIAGKLPPYESFTPSGYPIKVTVDREELIAASERAALFVNEIVGRSLAYTFEPESKTVRVSSRAPENGQGEYSIKASAFEGDRIAIGILPKYVIRALSAITSEEVTVQMSSPNEPIYIVHDSLTIFIMPIRLD